MFTKKSLKNNYEGAMEPFEIIKNVYFVGTYPASSHLIDTGDGLILIDTGYSDTLFLLINSIYKLGFSPCDIKYIIHTHWHGDHTAATAPLVHLTNAKTFIGEKDAEKVKKYFTPDVLLKEGDRIKLGNIEIDVVETPGHTEGCISLFFDVEDNGVKYKVGTFGGAGANTLKSGAFDYEDCRSGYRNSLNKLRKRNIDVFIGNHVWNNDTDVKGEILRATGENKFIDKNIWYEFLDFCEKRLDEVIKSEL
ncbi:MAG: MBL fold metallo-hydrolase [Ruminococcaceae bacterium]|nr:MBL fold metallo-hydrolase [Oscillospiraceae bacterium]